MGDQSNPPMIEDAEMLEAVKEKEGGNEAEEKVNDVGEAAATSDTDKPEEETNTADQGNPWLTCREVIVFLEPLELTINAIGVMIILKIFSNHEISIFVRELVMFEATQP